MFGIGFWELLIIVIVAILTLGPEKLPEAMVKIARFIKVFTKSINEAKQVVEEELNIQELKNDAKKYRSLLEKNTKEIKKTISFDELETLKENTKEINSTIEDLKASVQMDTNVKNATTNEQNQTKEEPKKDTDA